MSGPIADPRVVRNDAATPERAVWIAAAIAMLVPIASIWLLPTVAQPSSYHLFADQRTCLGIPNGLNVLSNIAFLIVGIAGLALTCGRWRRVCPQAFHDQRTALPYTVAFAGVALTAFGSAYYHWDPNDATLVWDRLPMALAFAGIVAGTLADRAPRIAIGLTLALNVVAVGTVLGWAGSGNLMPYLVMQVIYLAVALYATARLRSPFTRATWIFGALAVYGAAFVCEQLDAVIFDALGGWVSGHTIKHLLAAAAMAVVYAMLRQRSRAVT
jgi:hypothetical protein